MESNSSTYKKPIFPGSDNSKNRGKYATVPFKALIKVTQLIFLIMTLFLKLNKRLRSRPNVKLFTR